MLKVRTLFSGIGSPERSLKDLQIPFELVDFCEVDKYAIQSYCAVHDVSPSKNLGDITKVWGKNLPYADLLVWGFPCTDISLAGKQLGIVQGETRSGLYYEGLRILRETKPKYSVIENVKNLTSKKFKAEFEQMLKDIEELGYNNYWQVLNAKDYGIPQNRERVFIVSIRKDIDTHAFKFPQGFDNGLRLKDLLENEVDEMFYLSEERLNMISNWKSYQNPLERILGKNSNSPTLTARGAGEYHSGMILVDSNADDTYEIKRGTKITLEPKVIVKEATKKGYAEATIGDSINIQFPNSETRRGRVGHGVAQTLETACNQATLTYDYRIRKLTPKECWRLMGFKDEDFQRASDAGVSNSQLYKQAGNSIVSNVLFYIFKNLLQAEIAAIYEEEKQLS